ncbi:pilus assembly protein PilE [Marinobacter lutaoensis]|uniref:Pilus assembly protein PilE n=1 Tax=Marinobacter lutaoensis TaxID=135739 RepID=A0A1V2DVI5_9GAMM|nr:type IV pilin protein [Marinobacter lutaoensis]ONF44733.1 pilus assembly protein PilE [Marinobacter lutaoensis]
MIRRKFYPALRTLAGFTLIELMIVVAIIGIIAAIAYPSYQEHVRKTRRATAQADLMELAQWMERQYAPDYSYLDGGNQPVLPFTVSPRNGTAFYNLSFSGNVTQNGFTLQAVPTGAQAADRCGTLTLNSAGSRSAAEADCW